MAIINTPKSFSKEALGSSKTAKEIEPFVDYVNQNFDQLQRALINQLTISENLKGQVLSVKAKHNQRIDVRANGVVRYGFVLNSSVPVKSFFLNQDNTGNIHITVKFDTPIPISAQSQTNTTGQLFGIYRCTNIGGVTEGDIVSFSGFSTASNNGTALVLNTKIDQGAPILFCSKYPGVTSETMPSFVGNSEQFQSVTIALLYA